MDNFKHLASQKWVIGVSGGADSMALLDMCRRNKIDCVAAHVNYKKRDSADRDMYGVKAYCEKYNISLEIKIVDEKENGNFQDFARTLRYEFYRTIIRKYHCEGVLIAHQGDDVLETYLMQKKKKSVPQYYGIKENACVFGIQVYRPLLGYTKKELELYCEENGITYYNDETNFENHYTRNRIRHEIIDQMSLDEKHEMMKEIQNLNNNKMEKEEKIKQIIVKWGTSVEIETIRELDDIELMVRFWIEENTQIYHLSQKQIKEIVKRIKNLCVNWSIILDTEWEIVHNYGIISLVKKEDITYSYTIEKLEYKIFENVKLCAEGESTEAVTVCEEDFPICIRSPQKGDAIELRFGTKKLNRWFIDRKIPHSQRKSWPVVVNSKGKVILIPKIGCDVEHYSNNPNLFVIK